MGQSGRVERIKGDFLLLLLLLLLLLNMSVMRSTKEAFFSQDDCFLSIRLAAQVTCVCVVLFASHTRDGRACSDEYVLHEARCAIAVMCRILLDLVRLLRRTGRLVLTALATNDECDFLLVEVGNRKPGCCGSRRRRGLLLLCVA